jgi:hypothetical protein
VIDDEVNGFSASNTSFGIWKIKLFSYWKMSNCKKEFGVEARKVTEKFSITLWRSLAFYKSLIG